MRCETLSRLEEGRLVSPSAERNKGPVAEVLKQVLPDRGLVLEIGSGTGQHVVHFAREAPHLKWQPSERDAECLRSIALWLAAEGPANVLAPLRLDVGEHPWPIASAAAVVSLNMIHIAPWAAGMGLIRGAAAVLEPGACFSSMGPFAAEPGTRRRATRPLTGGCARRTQPGACAIWRRLRATPRRTVSARRRPMTCRRTIYPSCCARARRNRLQADRRVTDAGVAGAPRPLPAKRRGTSAFFS
jgi:Protein of unknown function (DUF938)